MRVALSGLALLTSGLVAAGSARADADGLIEPMGPREIAVGDAMRAGATGATGALLNPAGVPLTNELVFEGGYGYRPTDHASIIAVSGCDSTNVVPGCFYYHYLNASPELGGMELSRSSHTFGATLSRAIVPRILVGAGVKYFRYSSDMPGEGDAKGFTWDVGTTIRITDMINIGGVGYNLTGSDSPQFPRAIGAGALVRPIQNLTASFDALWNLDRDGKDGRYGGGLEYFLLTRQGQLGWPIRAGAVHDIAAEGTYLSAGLGLSTMKLGIDLGGRRQIRGGDEMIIVASLRIYGPRQVAPTLH